MLLWICFLIVFQPLTSFSLTLEVSQHGEYQSLRDAVKNTKDGPIILIKKGFYEEDTIVIDKSLSLIGEPGVEFRLKEQADATILTLPTFL